VSISDGLVPERQGEAAREEQSGAEQRAAASLQDADRHEADEQRVEPPGAVDGVERGHVDHRHHGERGGEEPVEGPVAEPQVLHAAAPAGSRAATRQPPPSGAAACTSPP